MRLGARGLASKVKLRGGNKTNMGVRKYTKVALGWTIVRRGGAVMDISVWRGGGKKAPQGGKSSKSVGSPWGARPKDSGQGSTSVSDSKRSGGSRGGGDRVDLFSTMCWAMAGSRLNSQKYGGRRYRWTRSREKGGTAKDSPRR